MRLFLDIEAIHRREDEANGDSRSVLVNGGDIVILMVSKFRLVIIAGFSAVMLLVASLIYFSERPIVADKANGEDIITLVSNPAGLPNSDDIVSDNVEFIDGVRKAYSRVRTVDMEATVRLKAFSNGTTVEGDVKVRYLARGDSYRLQVLVPENLEKVGLKRSMAVAWNGRRYFFHDYQVDVISYQSREALQLPSAVPNPFFLPLDLFSADDDACAMCRLRLQDLQDSERWADRRRTFKVISSNPINGLVHDLLVASGGKINGAQFDYSVRVVGHAPGTRQINSIARIGGDGRTLIESVFNKYSVVDGIDVKVPLEVNVIARDDGRPALVADFQINRLVLNRPLKDQNFEIDFGLANRVWDSDSQQLVANRPR